MTTAVTHQRRAPTQNLPHDLNPDEDELLGPVTNISIPGGHSDDSIALIISPGVDNL